MAAYSAVASFRQTMQHMLDSDRLPLDISKQQIESLQQRVCSLQSSLDQIVFVPKKLREKMSKLLTNIREAIYLGQDKVEYLVKGSSPEGSEEIPFKKIEDCIAAVEADAKLTAEEIKHDPQAQNLFSENSQPPKFNYSGKERIVGQKKDFNKIMDLVVGDHNERRLISVTGLPGIGKTTLARSIYDDKNLKKQFNIRAWVTVSQDYNRQETFSKLLSSMESNSHPAGYYTTQGDEQTLHDRLHKELYNQKYLMVIDDIWNKFDFDRIQRYLSHKDDGSCIIFTTRINDVAIHLKSLPGGFLHEMEPLDEYHSWKLLCFKTFSYEACEPYLKEDTDKEDIGQVCPPQLRDTGKSISRNCKGLPLSIVVVGGLLSQEKEKHDYWKRIEEDTADAVTKDEESSYLEILSLSYNYLPEKLKGCFLYMGGFPEDSEIRVSKLIKLWVAEGFLASSSKELVEEVAQNLLQELIGRNLVSVQKPSSNFGMKICAMHDSLRELAVKECKKEKFFHSMKKHDQKVEEEEETQRRVSVHRNILMCLEDVHSETRKVKYARSLLYVGSHHDSPIPYVLTFDLLRVLDAFTVFFIQFPEVFLQLLHLTYLSFTYNGKIPAKIAEFKKLQVLMVRRQQPKMIFIGASFLPDEIWTMPHLRHLWLTETDMPSLPPKIHENNVLLFNLQTLANVNARYFTDEVLDNMPNVKKLSMWIEGPEKINFNLDRMSKLELFKFVVLNPIPGKGIGVKAENFFAKTVRRLHLSGCGLPWEYMEFVANNLKGLEVLKLKEMAFHGETWSVDYDFDKLKYLLIEYLGFKTWEASNSNFRNLHKLILRHCYELEEIPQDFKFIGPLERVEMVDCSRPDAAEWADYLSDDMVNCEVQIFCSWE